MTEFTLENDSGKLVAEDSGGSSIPVPFESVSTEKTRIVLSGTVEFPWLRGTETGK